MNASDGDAESVDAFLERIASLKDRRDREDGERTRKMEEDILQRRRERQAKRAEHARSLSPTKFLQPGPSPSSANQLNHEAGPEKGTDSLFDLSPSPNLDTMEQGIQPGGIKLPAKEETPRSLPESPTNSAALPNTSATSLARSGTLSWQQRPSSRDSSSPRSRPISRYADEAASLTTSGHYDAPVRDQITLSLASKDPSWFRQTADRGTGSAAYRRNREQTCAEVEQSSRQLPGMSRQPGVETEKATTTPSNIEAPRSPSQASSVQDRSGGGDLFSSSSSCSTLGKTRSPLPMNDLQRFSLPTESIDSNQSRVGQIGMPSTNSPPARERPSSPTKGLGGFVQSAMMKRSDSVNKRWSAQTAPGLNRGNSTASYRGATGNMSSAMSGPVSPPRENALSTQGPHSSPSARTRPTSIQSGSVVLHPPGPAAQPSSQATSREVTDRASPITRLSIDTPSLHAGSQEPAVNYKSPSSQISDALPISPTKTMDPKRWSPSKASWLESALARPETPKLTSPILQTPSWMADLQKSKLTKEDLDSAKSPESSMSIASPKVPTSLPTAGEHVGPRTIGESLEAFTSGATRTPSPDRPREATVKVHEPEKSVKADSSLTLSNEPPYDDQAYTESKKLSKPVVDMNPDPITREVDRQQSSVSRPKPQTPPKTDFRSNLRPRHNFQEQSSLAEPEFKNVFGKLKRTETKNYVAPDELKSNILRGKAALSLTGGPQKAPKVDEFKESILKKKDSMKGGASPPVKNISDVNRSDISSKGSNSLPEALMRRKTLNKGVVPTKGLVVDSAAEKTIIAPSKAAPKVEEQRLPSIQDQESAINDSIRSRRDVRGVPAAVRISKLQKQDSTGVEDRKQLDDPEKTSRKSNITFTNPPLPMSEPVAPAATDETPDCKVAKGTAKLANRINPSLAGIISRGPASVPSSQNVSGEDLTPARSMEARSSADSRDDLSSGQLTHMTKARAKGPKRRLPKTQSGFDTPERSFAVPEVTTQLMGTTKAQSIKERGQPQTPSGLQSEDTQISGIPSRALADLANNNDKVIPPRAGNDKSAPPATDGHDLQGGSWKRSRTTQGVTEKTKPAVAAKSSDLRKVTSPAVETGILESAQLSGEKEGLQIPASGQGTEDIQVDHEKIDLKMESSSDPLNVPRHQDFVSISSDLTQRSAETSARRSRTGRHEAANDAITDPATFAKKPILRGLGLNLGKSQARPQLTPPPEDASKGWGSLDRRKDDRSKIAVRHEESVASKQSTLEIDKLLTEYFDEWPKLSQKAEIDAHAVIINRPSTESKSQMLKTQIWQVNADGKKESLPPHQGHILYEDCIYLCVHSFKTSTAAVSTEVYLWSGDGVGEAAVEDAQLFCRKEARENNTRLELVKQGKEPAKFFQALGGIVITRRSKRSALYMLCGRRHLGHIAFDEVDLDASSLCSGFPYIISAKFGKLYLWKGKGSGADEIGCARLIGMDLGLIGEIEEVDEDEEPSSFFESLGSATRRQNSSPQWVLRSRSGNYGCRLFRIELEQARSIAGFWIRRGSSPSKPSKAKAQEIQPFCQKDLDSSSIYVLDAYFNIFVYVGNAATSKSAEFVTALIFAQEYGILAASLEDRPSIPTCNIAFYGAPLDLTFAFRKWDHSDSLGQSQQGLPLQVIALNEMLEKLGNEADGR